MDTDVPGTAESGIAASDTAEPSAAPRPHPRSRPLTNWHSARIESLSRGDRAADVMRNRMGSWWFVGAFLAFMIVWAVLNAMSFTWDPYPYILLNLFLSMLAGLQGAILLIAAKRQDALAAALAQHDYETNLAAKEEIEQLMTIIQEQHVLLREIHQHMAPGVRDQVTND